MTTQTWKANKNFQRRELSGFMRILKKDETFQIDWAVEHEDALQLAQNGLAYPCNDKIVPPEADYLVHYSFYKVEVDKVYEGQSGQTVRLPRHIANPLMGSAHVRPVDPKAWYPQRLPELEELKKETTAKKMFGEVVSLAEAAKAKEKGGFARGWREK